MQRSNEASGPKTGVSRRIAGAVVLAFLGLTVMQAAPAWGAALDQAAAPDRPEVSQAQMRAYGRWWDGQVEFGSLAVADVPLGQLQAAAEQAYAAGVTRQELRAALFTDVARDVLAGNAAGGEHEPSPYLAYFRNNPTMLGPLGRLFVANPAYLVGSGGTQDLLFAQFPGLRESYLASLGLQEVNGRIVDPRMPYLSPYLASRFLGEPEPLAQPAAALNVIAP